MGRSVTSAERFLVERLASIVRTPTKQVAQLTLLSAQTDGSSVPGRSARRHSRRIAPWNTIRPREHLSPRLAGIQRVIGAQKQRAQNENVWTNGTKRCAQHVRQMSEKHDKTRCFRAVNLVMTSPVKWEMARMSGERGSTWRQSTTTGR